MKISLNWLQSLVDIRNKKPQELAQLITEHSLEVEKIISGKQGYKFTNVFVAKVLSWEKHPNADRLRVVKLDLGGTIIDPIVCGANNFNYGDLVALALPGAHIAHNFHSPQHEGFELKKTEIRGVLSQGMLCAKFELGMVEEFEDKPEILILNPNLKIGLDLKEALNVNSNDTIFDLVLPANRPDLFSHMGIARELVGILGFKPSKQLLQLQKQQFSSELYKIKKQKLKVNLQSKNCTFYIALRAKVRVGPTPNEINKPLVVLGHGGVNNVVDITNYIMHEVGQPMHAFDASKVEFGIIVRQAKVGEKIVALDGKEYSLDPEVMVIADQKKALGIAGVMGGKESGVQLSTTEIILESATFEPISVRKTARKLGLRSDASTVYEKGLSKEQAILGMLRAIELMKKHCDLQISEFYISEKIKTVNRKINFDVQQINTLLGFNITVAQIKKYLARLNIKSTGNNKINAEIPFYRNDLEDYTSIADELLKIHGINNIARTPLKIERPTQDRNIEKPYWQIKQHMVTLGFNEVQNHSFISKEDIKKFGLDEQKLLRIKNPLSSETEYLKPHLLIPLLKNIALNQKNASNFKLFEIGFGYKGYLDETDLLTLVIFDKQKTLEGLIANAKSTIENLVKLFSDADLVYEINQKGLLDIKLEKQGIGNTGAVFPNILNQYGIEGAVVYGKIELQKLFVMTRSKKFEPFSRFPTSTLDISLVVPNKVLWQQIEHIVKAHGQALVQYVDLFNAPHMYLSENLPQFHKKLLESGKKNLAFHVVYGSFERTLKDSEISLIHAKIIGELHSKLNAEIR